MKEKNEGNKYSIDDICSCLCKYSKDYINEKRRAISNIDTKVRDAVLVDVINYLAKCNNSKYILYTQGLYERQKNDKKIDSQFLMPIITKAYSYYLFDINFVDSIFDNRHMNECKKRINEDDGFKIILDFINYVAKNNGYEKKITAQELLNIYMEDKNAIEFKKMGHFIEITSSQKLTLKK